ncbi:MAG TPA: DEAD/DEAH box helicase [Methylocella sp.]|nr:DEAD/DEAH box helicase [Methylocella sp.]
MPILQTSKRGGISTAAAPVFHPAVAAWFVQNFAAPTAAQAQAWPAIKAGEHVLVAAPTGSGKTLAAFLAAIDTLIRQGLEDELKDETQIVYVSPLKALSNDIEKNLKAPLAGICASLQERGLPGVEIRTLVRTGDTPQGSREQMRRRPPHILVTTPESLYILLTSESGRAMLSTTRTIIIDEIHALAANKRGAHLSLSLERLAALCGDRLLRVGLSATQKPIEEVARFLTGTGNNAAGPQCKIIDTGHCRERDLAIELPPSPLEAVMSGEVRDLLHDQLARLIEEHRTTLIFVNTRRLAERTARALSERLGTDRITAHHGSMAKEHRHSAEARLKRGELKALVATASLELGIDIGDIDLVCQIGSPRSIAAFLQRVGRSGHAIGGIPKGRLFPLTRDDLLECAALLDSVKRGELDQLEVQKQPLDVLAQQIVAEVSAQQWDEEELFNLIRRAWPYRDLSKLDFVALVQMLAEGFSTKRGRRGALIHYDSVNHRLRGRRGARLTAITSGGAIPDNADYRVLLEPGNLFIGTLNEDFAVESLAGDVFQLGNHSYRILRVERGTVRVADAEGMPPSIPFWIGEAPGRTDELSFSVSRLCGNIAALLKREGGRQGVEHWLRDEIGLSDAPAAELAEYLVSGHAALGGLPTQNTLVFERFFDESGGMQFVIHSPFGSRINRAWGLALRKRFCRKFNFELQAAATDDNILLSLTASHSFELGDVKRYLNVATVRDVLIQALLTAPMFMTRWRWVAGVALALPRFRGGRKVPPQIARMEAEDLIAAVFPDQLACAENLVGEREVPDHPLVRQTIDDCLTEAMDIRGLEYLLSRIERGEIEIIIRDLTAPSPLALEVLSSRPYSYLDDAPIEERRAQAVMARRWLSPESAADLGKLDDEAIARVREEAWPDAANADELHDALVWLGFFTEREAAIHEGWAGWLADLGRERRAARILGPNARLWIAAERLPQFRALWPTARVEPDLAPANDPAEECESAEKALVEILRGQLEGLGPVTADNLAASLGIASSEIHAALIALEAEGFALRGQFTPASDTEEWCDRRLLARIHHYTVKRLRAEIEPVSAHDFLRFLLAWQKVTPEARMEGPEALLAILEQLEGFEAPAGAWESEILPARLENYDPAWLDDHCLAGRIAWARLRPISERWNGASRTITPAPLRTTPITFLSRRNAPLWASISPKAPDGTLSGNGQAALDFIRAHGASFFDEIAEGAGLLSSQAEEALAELAAMGLVSSDSFGGLRALLVPSELRRPTARRARRRGILPGMQNSGRWALARRPRPDAARGEARADAIEHVALSLLRRYGVVFRRLLEREAAWLPQWRDLLRVYRKLEARGEIRGGRFVAGFAGEQYALPEAVGLMREIKRKPLNGETVSLSGADPLNLIGIITPDGKLPALTTSRVLYVDGSPVALLTGGEVRFLERFDSAREWALQKALRQSPPQNHGTSRRAVAAGAA